MAFILGGTGVQYNKDPKKLSKYVIDPTATYLMRDAASFDLENSGNEGAYYSSSDNYFVRSPASNVSADTDITIVNISGQSGFLTHCISPTSGVGAGYQTTWTWVITVDGVATTITMGAGISGNYYKPAEARSVMGGFLQYLYPNSAGTWNRRDDSYYSNQMYDNARSYYTTSGTMQMTMTHPEEMIMRYPLACVRFETSLNVKVQQDRANTDTYNRIGGVAYIADG